MKKRKASVQTFDGFDWKRAERNWAKWFNGTLGRPTVVQIRCEPEAARTATSALPAHSFAAHYDFSVPARDAFYHLDGIGQIPHVPHLCAIPWLAGIQWIPGDGQPHAAEWPDLLNQIVSAGKLLQVPCTAAEARKILPYIKRPEAVAFFVWGSEQEDTMRLLAECGIC